MPGPPQVPETGLDHVAWAVRDLASAARLFAADLGGRVVAGGDELELNVRSVHIVYPGRGKVELLSPIGPGPIAAFVDRYGDRVHHVTFTHTGPGGITGLAGRLSTAGRRVVGLDTDHKAWQELFVGPGSAFGCILQVVDRMDQYGAAVPGLTLASVLAGEWSWQRGVPVRREDMTPAGGS